MRQTCQKFTVCQAKNGEWFYSYVNQDDLMNVGYWKSAEDATAAAHLALAQPHNSEGNPNG